MKNALRGGVFICTKPLQILMCLPLKKSEEDEIFLCDYFNRSLEISKKISTSGVFIKSKWFKTKKQAIFAAAKLRPQKIYIDSDIGLSNLTYLAAAKLISPKTTFHVFEEGIGSYRDDIITSKAKRTIYKLLGAATIFGECTLTESIYLTDPHSHKDKIPKLKTKIEKIPSSIVETIDKNREALEEVFSIKSIRLHQDSDQATLYLTDWNIEPKKIIDKLRSNKNAYIKPHPHTSKESMAELEKHQNIILLPSAPPAEIIAATLLKKHSLLNLIHRNSSAAHYLSKVKGINLINEAN